MSEFQNTIDLLGDKEVLDAIVEGSIVEFNDNKIRTIRGGCFCKITTLKSVNMPLVTSIGERVFSGCTSLESANLPNLQEVGGYCFSTCYALKSADFPNVTSASSYAFSSCTSIKVVNFPNITTVGSSAFNYCSSLESANLPNATSVGDRAFTGCDKLVSVNLPLWEPRGAPSYVFQKCASLPSIDLPKVQKIGTYMFSGCTVLKTVILRYNSVCPLSSVNSFENTPFASGGTGGTLLVPRSLTASYQTATNWSSIFSGNANNRVLALEDYTIDGTITGEIDWDKLNGGTT